jgi:hypothetical protein
MSNKNFVGWTIARLIGVLIFLSIIAFGGYMAYKAGIAQGISQAPEVAEAIQQSAEDGQGAPMMYERGFGYGYPYHHGFGFGPHFGFFPLGFCFSIVLLFFFLGMLRFIFRPWSWHRHGHWGKSEGGVPPMFEKWHKRAHGETSSEDSK